MAGRTAYTALIKEYAEKHGVDADLMEALVITESGGKADAFRWEPVFWERYQLVKKPEYAKEIPRRWSSSYGLCQIMGVVAKEMGFDSPDPEQLFIPSVNLDYGCAKLRSLFDWAQEFKVSDFQQTRAALAAYNGGKGGNRPTDTPLRNGRYADVVAALAHTLHHL